MNTTIIGAGPVGSYLASKLARKHEVTLIEEHAKIGAPVQCTGILTDDVSKHITKTDLASITKAVVTSTVVHSPNNKVSIDIKPNYVIDNIKHCQMLADQAHDRGATLLTKHRYRDNATTVRIADLEAGKDKEFRTDLLIGADGPNSIVAKKNGLFGKRSFLTGVQAVVKVKDYDDRIHFYPSIGEYAWYCPEGDGKARIGVAAPAQAKKIFDSFIKKFPGKVSEMQGGAIPLYRPKPQLQTAHNNMTIQLIGDSVPLIKNTTGGGIIPGMNAAQIHAQDPTRYEQRLGPLKKELFTHYLINKAMNKFTPQDWDSLIRQAQDDNVQHILKSTNRDNAYAMAAQLIRVKPTLLRWALKML